MYIGIDVGGTTIKFALVSERGAVSERGSIQTNWEKSPFFADMSKIVQDFQKNRSDIQGVGISAPGVIQKDGLMTTAGAIKSLYGVNLKEEIEKRVGLPVFVENDANAAAIAENWIGQAQGIDNYLCIVLGTGIGGGIVINGDVYRGYHGMAGEFGWMMIDQLPDTGNIEAVSLNQRSAIVGGLCHQYALAKQAEDPNFELIKDAQIILEREATDPIAKRVVEQFYQDLAVGLVNLISCFDPEVVLIGGGISANESFFERLTAAINLVETRHDSIAYLKEAIIAPVKPAKLKNDAGLIGAVYQIHKELARKKETP